MIHKNLRSVYKIRQFACDREGFAAIQLFAIKRVRQNGSLVSQTHDWEKMDGSKAVLYS